MYTDFKSNTVDLARFIFQLKIKQQMHREAINKTFFIMIK